MEIAEVADRKSLEAYLDGLIETDRETGLLTARRIAFLAAVRIAPIGLRYFAERPTPRKRELTALPHFAAMAIGGVAVLYPTLPIERSTAAAVAAFIPDAAASAAAATAATAAAADANAAAVAAAAAATAANATAANVEINLWEHFRQDLFLLEADPKGPLPPIWGATLMPSEIKDAWTEAKRLLTEDSAGHWGFWIAWYERVLAGKDIKAEALAKVLNTLTREDLLGDPGEVNTRFDHILEIYEDEGSATETTSSHVSDAAYFDFIEVNRKMKATGFPSDRNAFDSDEARAAFADAIKDIKAELDNWTDYAREDLKGRNEPLTLVISVEKLIDQMDGLGKGESVSLRRLISVGSDVRRFATDDSYRGPLNDNLTEMLDERLDDYSEIVRAHLGNILLVLDALRQLDLGDLDSGDVLDTVRAALKRMETASEDDILPLDPASAAVLRDMLIELEDVQSGIGEAKTDARRQTLRKRFAEKFGGYSATYGHYVEKGSEAVQTNTKRFDEAVKWYKRMDTVRKIVDWWDKLFPGGGGA